MWHQFPFRHPSREVPMVGSMVVSVQVSVVKVFCVCPKDKDTKVDGQWRWLQSLQQVEGKSGMWKRENNEIERNWGKKRCNTSNGRNAAGILSRSEGTRLASSVGVAVCGVSGCIPLQCCCSSGSCPRCSALRTLGSNRGDLGDQITISTDQAESKSVSLQAAML